MIPFAAYVSLRPSKPRLIFSRINGPNVYHRTAVCVLFLIKLRWPKNKRLYDTCPAQDNTLNFITLFIWKFPVTLSGISFLYTKFNQGSKISRVDIPFKFNRLTRNYLSCLGQTHQKLYTPFLGKEMSKSIPCPNLVPRVLSYPFLQSERESGNEVTPQSSDTSPYRPKKGVPPTPTPDQRCTYGSANKGFVHKTILIP